MKICRALWLVTISLQFGLLFFIASQSKADPEPVIINPLPFSVPVQVCFVKTSPGEALKSLEKELRVKGYEVSARLDHKGEFIASRPQVGGSQDKYLIWFGRDLDDCNQINVFVQYARFMQVLGKGLKRVIVDESYEQEHIAEFVKSSLETVFSCQWYQLEMEPPLR